MMEIRLKTFSVKISFWFAAFIALLSIYNKIAFLSIASMTLHESGHILMMKRIKCMPDQINIGLCNIGITDRYILTRSLRKDIYVFIAGSAVNIVFFLLSGIIYKITGNELIRMFSSVNLSLAVFNLLPVYGLDGGSILHRILIKFLDISIVKKVVTILSVLVIFFIGVLGFLILLYSKYNFTLLILSCLMIWGIVVKNKEE